MIVGRTGLAGASPHPFGGGYRVGTTLELTRSSRVAAILAYLAGNGAEQILRGVIYDADGARVAIAGEQIIGPIDAPEWVGFPLSGVELEAGVYTVQLHSGDPSNGAAWYGVDAGAGASNYVEDLYANGPAATVGALQSDSVAWLLALELYELPTGETAATRALEALLSLLDDAGVEATRDVSALNPSPVGVLLGLPELVSATLGARTFEVPVLVISGDPVNASAPVDRLYATADAIAAALSINRYRPTTWGGSSRTEPLAALELSATVTVETQEG